MDKIRKKAIKRRATVEINEFNKKSQIEADIEKLAEADRDKSDEFDRMKIENQGRRATMNALNLEKEMKQN